MNLRNAIKRITNTPGAAIIHEGLLWPIYEEGGYCYFDSESTIREKMNFNNEQIASNKWTVVKYWSRKRLV